MKCDGCGENLSVADACKMDEVERKVYHRRCWRAAQAKKRKEERVAKEKDEEPAWLKQGEMVKATFAFENGRSAYGGFVVDLGDGTCRLANTPLLGEHCKLKYGDRVDLFYNPCDPLSRPFIGLRAYPEEGPLPGTHHGKQRTPTAEEEKAHKAAFEKMDEDQLEWMERRFKGDLALMNYVDLLVKYADLLDLAKKNKLDIPPELLDYHAKDDDKQDMKTETVIREEERARAFKIVERMRERCGCPPDKFCESFGCESLRQLANSIRDRVTEE